MAIIVLCVLISLLFVLPNETARILAVFPTPLIIQQSVYQSIFQELISRNHEVVLITALPEYPKGTSPENLMEIDVSNATKQSWEETFSQGLKYSLRIAAQIVEKQFQIPEVKSLINNNETFDLLLLEGWIRPTLFWTYIYDVPVISIGSLDLVYPSVDPTILLPEMLNLNVWNRIVALYEYWKMNTVFDSLEKEENIMAKRIFGEVPPLSKQVEKIEMTLLNTHPVWQGVRPVPMNIIHLGQIYLQDRGPKTEFTEELKAHLDSNINGVVYVNVGTKLQAELNPDQAQRKLIQAFSKLPYSILWKWEGDIEGLPHNVRVGKWFPQAEILKHPNVCLFISQSEQQSIDDAIAAAVPLLALPLTANHWRNAEQLLRYNVGIVLNFENVEHQELANLVEHTAKNESYRNNMLRIRTLLSDTRAPAPVRAADAIEYVLRQTIRHITSPKRHTHWYQYMEIELFLTVITVLSISIFVLYTVLYYMWKKIVEVYRQKQSEDTVLRVTCISFTYSS